MICVKKNISDVFGVEPEEEKAGVELVETILMIGAFAVATVAMASWLVTAILNKAADTADCIEGSAVYAEGAGQKASEHCQKQDRSKEHSFKNDKAYKDRFEN